MKRIDPNQNPFLRVLLYGAPGSLKTRTAYTAALDDRTYPCLALNASGNPLSTRDYKRQADILNMEQLSDFNDPFNWLAAGQNPDAEFCKEFKLNPPYKSVIVDGVTEVQRLSFNCQTTEQIDPGTIPLKLGRPEFYNTLRQMTNFSKLYFSLPMHVIMTSLEKIEKTEAGTLVVSPLLWGQGDIEIPAYAYVVGRMFNRLVLPNLTEQALQDVLDDKTVSVVLFRQSEKYAAKDQYGMLGDYMINPTIGKMLDLIEAKPV